MSEPKPSAWLYWPTVDQPSNRYKYISVEFNLSLNQMVWTRQTYHLLDWLGDLGGLLDILYYIGRVLVEPIARFTLQSTLMVSLFRFKQGKTLKTDSSQFKKSKHVRSHDTI